MEVPFKTMVSATIHIYYLQLTPLSCFAWVVMETNMHYSLCKEEEVRRLMLLKCICNNGEVHLTLCNNAKVSFESALMKIWSLEAFGNL